MVKLKQTLENIKLRTQSISKQRTTKLGALLLIVLAVIVISLMAAYWKSSQQEKKVDCMGLVQSARKNLGQNDKNAQQAAYAQLKPTAEQCGTLSSDEVKQPENIQEYIDLMEYNGNLAVAAYVAGDKEQAKVYAEQGIKLNESRTPEQSSKIPQDQKPRLNEALANMYDIRDGNYLYSPSQFINSSGELN